MLGYASSAGAFAFSTATSYVFRPDASTSSLPDRKPPPSSSSSLSSSNSSGTHPHGATNGRSRGGHRQHADALAPSKRPHTNKDGTRRTRPISQLPSAHLPNGTSTAASTSTGSGTTSTSNGGGRAHADQTDKREGQNLVDRINLEDDLYRILGVARKSKAEEIRRAFLSKSRLCHPDKLPDYEPATPAFQRLSYAYETLSKPTSRRMYDLGGGKSLDHGPPRGDADSGMCGDETLNGVLRNVFTEFLAGDFEMIRVFVNALNDGNPGLNLGDEAVDNLEGAFRKVREVLLSGQKYMRIVKFELIRLYEIQHSLRSLGYFDLVGRFRLTLALTRVTLEIPMVLDRTMRDEVPNVPYGLGPPGKERETKSGNRETNGEERGGRGKIGEASGGSAAAGAGELQRRGLLGPRVKGVLVVACKMLEKAEKFGT